jgi:hypothetical protein
MDSEDICRRCGRCCYYKVLTDVGPAFTRRPCQFLDVDKNLCKAYSRRFEKGVGCLPTEEAIRLRALPSDCPYVKDIEGYVGPMTAETLEKMLGK